MKSLTGYSLVLSVLAVALFQGCASSPEQSGVVPFAKPAQQAVSAAQREYDQGKAWLTQGELSQAMRSLDRCLQLEPTHVEALNAKASILATQGNLAQASRTLTRALTIDDARAHVHYNMGLVKRMQGDLPGARIAFQRVIELDAAHTNARNALTSLPAIGNTVAQPLSPTVAQTGHMSLVRVPRSDAQYPSMASIASTGGLPVAVGSQLVVPESVAIAARLDTEARIVVLNARGVSQLARTLSVQWRDQGAQVSRAYNRDKLDMRQTRIYYRPGYENEARQIAQRLPVQASVVPASAGAKRELLVIIGKDMRGYKLTDAGWESSAIVLGDAGGDKPGG